MLDLPPQPHGLTVVCWLLLSVVMGVQDVEEENRVLRQTVESLKNKLCQAETQVGRRLIEGPPSHPCPQRPVLTGLSLPWL